MLRVFLAYLTLGIISINCSVFNISPDLFEKHPQCQSINETLYKYVNTILTNLNETSTPIQRTKRETGGKFYNFTIGYEKSFQLYTQVPDDIQFPYKSEYSPFPFFLPPYWTEVTTFHDFPEKFVLITGKRCRWKCKKETKECEVLKCWERPSLCIGEVDECAKHDGDGTCTQISHLKVNNNLTDDDEYSSTDLGNLFKADYSKFFINENGKFLSIDACKNFWKCSLTSETDVICYNSGGVCGNSLGLLKTIAG